MDQRLPAVKPQPDQGTEIQGTEVKLREMALKWFRDTQAPLILPKGNFPSWFLGFISRRDAEKSLKDKELGCFLIRLSDKAIGYILSYRGRDRCRHFVINQSKSGQFIVSGDTEEHVSLTHLIEHYRVNPIQPFGENLTCSCLESSSNVIYDTVMVKPEEKPLVNVRAMRNQWDQLSDLNQQGRRARMGPSDQDQQGQRTRIGPSDQDQQGQRTRMGPSDQDQQGQRTRMGPSDQDPQGRRTRMGTSDQDQQGQRTRMGPSDQDQQGQRTRMGPSDQDQQGQRTRMGTSDQDQQGQRTRMGPSDQDPQGRRTRMGPYGQNWEKPLLNLPPTKSPKQEVLNVHRRASPLKCSSLDDQQGHTQCSVLYAQLERHQSLDHQPRSLEELPIAPSRRDLAQHHTSPSENTSWDRPRAPETGAVYSELLDCRSKSLPLLDLNHSSLNTDWATSSTLPDQKYPSGSSLLVQNCPSGPSLLDQMYNKVVSRKPSTSSHSLVYLSEGPHPSSASLYHLAELGVEGTAILSRYNPIYESLEELKSKPSASSWGIKTAKLRWLFPERQKK
ncbi:hypothetical protein DPEC_G00158760 [Dallia pectoralis]|uniref:Uncharacterized protein n=1 Tax=Dallia pectoralis TaxID=75939 RepID=A0ACC2GG33_DALPE|nr:hypothetical protein DPEC_G00158760 [Dallia pectoralis]